MTKVNKPLLPCKCGCGEIPGPRSRGKQFMYVPGHRIGKHWHSWKGGRKLDQFGYVEIRRPSHPRANTDGYVKEHLVIAEKGLGRPLLLPHQVHHVDGNKGNNATNNLVICESLAYHFLLHQRERALRACGHADWLRCTYCKQYEPPGVLKHSSRYYYHNPCATAANRIVIAKREARKRAAQLIPLKGK